MGVKVVGYYVDYGVDKVKAKAEDIFLVFVNNRPDIGDYYEGYSPVGQHFEVKDNKYLNVCTEIDSKDYARISKEYHTPKEYLGK